MMQKAKCPGMCNMQIWNVSESCFAQNAQFPGLGLKCQQRRNIEFAKP